MAKIRSLLWALVLLCFCIGVFAQDAEQTQSQSLSLSPSPSRTTAEPVETTTRNVPSNTQDEDAEETEEAQKPGLSVTETTTSRTSTQSSDRSSSTIFSSSVRSSIAPSSTSSIAPVPSPTIRTTEDWYKPEEEKLPLQPVLTPAFGFGGALLIISGLIIGFVGIQHRLIYIFLSCVYLVSLSITVLIIYVVNPPASDAVQGGYLVGIVVPGLMLGAGAMVFSNLTEGFGCLLGGFCLAMWLLCLKAGGLLQNSTGVVILICCFCAVVWGTAYVRWFQPYTLIFSLSFSGATAVILGIDCFSRAGLKEFWIYIWRLNDKIFPYGTTTYPMTRGIKAEVAGIVAFTVLGMLSQMKLWGFIKKKNKRRQDRKDAERRGLESEEETVGQRVNWEITRARERWEEVYEQSQTKMSANGEIIEVKSLGSDSGVGDMSAKGLTTTNMRKWTPQITAQATEIEMNDMPKFNSPTSSRPSSADRNWGCGPDSDSFRLPPSDEQRKDRKSNDLDALAALEGAATRSGGRNEKRDSKPKRVSGSPDTPFPTLDVASPATRTSERLSTGSRKLLNRLSHISTGEMSKSQERLTGYDDEGWDDSSSVAATIDELDSDNDLDGLRSLPSGTPRVSMVLDNAINASDPDPASGWKGGAGGSGKEAEVQTREPIGPWPGLTSDVLPPAPLKRVVSGFRTHEWTKRLEVAEEPTIAPLPVTPIVATFPVSASSPSHSSRKSGCESPASHTIPEDVAVDHETPSTPTRQSSTANAAPPPLESVPTEVEEASAPVHLEALAQTTLNGEVAPAPPRPRSSHAHMSLRPKFREHRTSHNPYRTSTGLSRQGSWSRPSSGQGQGITRSSSYGSLAPLNTQFRTSSNPLQPLSEHDDDNVSLKERQTFLRQSSMPMGPPSAHLASAPSPYRMSSQQLPQHLAHQQQGLERRLSAQQLSAQQQSSRRASREPHSMERLNRGVVRPGMTDLEIMEVRRKELLEERKRAQMVKEEGERRRVMMEGQWSNRYRESVRMSGAGAIGDDVHREGLRRMMSDAAIGNGGR